MTLDRLTNAALQPPEPQLCTPGEHVPDSDTFRVSDEDRPYLVVLVDCETCGAVADIQPQPGDWQGWEL